MKLFSLGRTVLAGLTKLALADALQNCRWMLWFRCASLFRYDELTSPRGRSVGGRSGSRVCPFRPRTQAASRKNRGVFYWLIDWLLMIDWERDRFSTDCRWSWSNRGNACLFFPRRLWLKWSWLVSNRSVFAENKQLRRRNQNIETEGTHPSTHMMPLPILFWIAGIFGSCVLKLLDDFRSTVELVAQSTGSDPSKVCVKLKLWNWKWNCHSSAKKNSQIPFLVFSEISKSHIWHILSNLVDRNSALVTVRSCTI